ncbi:amino acid adenylation domain-containing protein [Kitasatospora sp. NPDC004745]|uniref:amino acid adenylation domain-containing protein n=1 Tax=Kitasatospora sp. NPDC004745 TaxID=3364019 RepID=UPI0036AC5926
MTDGETTDGEPTGRAAAVGEAAVGEAAGGAALGEATGGPGVGEPAVGKAAVGAPPAAGTVHGLVEEQARLAPLAVAVRCGAEELTYRELDARATALARDLASRGLAPGGRAAVALGRGTGVYVALLAVLKTGAAYVPLEPSAPDALLRHVLTDAAPDLVVTEEGHRVRLADAGGAPVVCPDLTVSADGPFDAPATGPADLACVFYTSGTTGPPTGALIGHDNLLAAHRSWCEVYGLTAEDRILQTASLEFDVFTADWVRALCTGAALVVAPRNLTLDRTADVAELPALVADERITVVELNVRTARRLSAFLERTGRALPGVRLLTVGAEKWYLDEQLGLQRLLGERTRVLNVYGLAEATVDSTYFDARGSAVADGGERVSLVGRPFPGTRVYVVGPKGLPVAPGRPGEIAVAGSGLGRGYLGRPDDTRRRFVRADFDPDGRVLLTGDVGLLRPDGVLEFLGRAATVLGPVDHPGKASAVAMVLTAARAEGVLRSHPAVREAAVVELEPRPGQRRLVGYAVAEPAADGADGWSLSQHLAAELPGAAAPSAVVVVPDLPRTRAGKLDRSALPLPAPPEHTAARTAALTAGRPVKAVGGKAGGKAGGGGSESRSVAGCAAVFCVLLFGAGAWAITDEFFPGSTDVSLVPSPYDAYFRLLYLCENLAFGAGVVYLAAGFEAVLRQGRPYRLSVLTHLAITWLLVNWWPQDNLYRLTSATDWPRETALVFAFNIPLMLAALVVVRFVVWRPPVGEQ